MADNETTTTAPVAPAPVAEASPVEHTQSTVDPTAIQKVLEGLSDEGAQSTADNHPAAGESKSDDTYKPFGDIQNVP